VAAFNPTLAGCICPTADIDSEQLPAIKVRGVLLIRWSAVQRLLMIPA
jgi:hypothetical protein